MLRPCIHFVAFRGEEYWSAVKVWGRPDFVHIGWDRRALREIGEDDIVIFAQGTERNAFPVNSKTGRETTFPDIVEREPK